MKKLILCTIMLLSMIGIAGCSKEEIFITTEDVSGNTMLAKANGIIQVATVEEWDKAYYNLNDLEEFVKKEVNAYNQSAGGDKVTIDEGGLALNKGKAIMLLTYTGMDQYTEFNQVSAAYFNGGVANIPISLPDTLVSVKDNANSNTSEVVQNSKYKVLVINEPYEVIVDGSLMYYSNNAVINGDNKLQSAEDGMTVVVYKP